MRVMTISEIAKWCDDNQQPTPRWIVSCVVCGDREDFGAPRFHCIKCGARVDVRRLTP